jgi:N utilization substance protein B
VKRSELREHIFRMIFGYEFNSDAEMPEQMQLYFEQLDEEDGVPTEAEVTYIREKALNVILKTEEIDELLNTNTKGWKTSRMNKVDLSILRLAVYEMKWDDEIPAGVAIDQAVELAKKYSGDEGPSFINGVLAKLV